MPCWYYDKKDLRNTPSIRDGIDFDTEARYRREGARFINEAGQKLGLRHDTCATGVVYFHRFYMYHSFREFYRYVIATTCLFLAGKVEETPKKCKDIIKTVRGILPDQQFSLFGSDPKEEVMTMERILLQTIKFDLQVEHPYSFLLKYAKTLRGDKAKIQKMVQMSWTFINDGYCTSLCLQWEPEIIAVSLMYLASRLNKFEITDWQDKPPGFKGKWWDQFIEDMSMELMEDICHQVLDLYSQSSQAQKRAESPPLRSQGDQPPPPPPSRKPQGTPPRGSKSRRDSSNDRDKRQYTPGGDSGRRSASRSGGSSQPPPHYQGQGESQYVPPPSGDSTTAYNPYVSSQMYSSSFMNQEGLQNISSLMMSNPPPASAPPYQPASSAYGQYPQQYQQQPPVTQQAPPPQHPMYTQPGYHAPPMQQQQQQPQLHPQQQPMPQYPPQAPQFRGYVPPPQQQPQPQPNYQPPAPSQAGYNPGYQPPVQQYPPQQGYPNQQFMGNQGPPPPMSGPTPMPQGPPRHQGPREKKGLKAANSSNLVVLGGARK